MTNISQNLNLNIKFKNFKKKTWNVQNISSNIICLRWNMKSGWWWMNFINYQWKMNIKKWISIINKDVNNDDVGENLKKLFEMFC